ncbi:MarC family protein [Stenotrophomonas sp. PFBMAA-4]|uniref:MarC family protein n=1 Tax=Stenotrophomonas sp. PFBMAA-4 TaxID=3043301 RepID=UPI0024B5C2CF|nr:MarC family protein [Stenotrophomonas sp. PFBMAA-4]MDI9271826.1 MarC family protein [Stenotrophomonas sp. PFBMAA-4]
MASPTMTQTLQYTIGSSGDAYGLPLADVFVLFFIMMGPIKSIAFYAAKAGQLGGAERRKLSLRVFLISSAAVLAAGLVGGNLLRNWHIAPAVLQAAGGLVFLLVALRMLLSQYESGPASSSNFATKISATALSFPITVPAYAFAAVIVLVALSHGAPRTLLVLSLAVVVLALDALFLAFIPWIVRTVGTTTLAIVGAILGVMQVALALQFIVGASASLMRMS